MIVAVANTKGGVGKTTIALHLAVLAAQRKKDVLVADADVQRSSSEFIAVRESENHKPSLTSSVFLGKNAGNDIKKMREKFDLIIADIGGMDNTTLRSILIRADILVVPVIPGQFEMWVLEQMDGIVDMVKEINPNLKVITFLNNADTNPKIEMGRNAVDLSDPLRHLSVSGDIIISSRIAFRRAIAEGLIVNELKERKDHKAILEIENLYEKVFRYEAQIVQ